nr:Chain A, SMRT corepressor SP2 fragment [Homo sapiens]
EGSITQGTPLKY